MSDVRGALDAALEGGPERHRKKVAEQQKLPVRERVARLLDQDSLAEEGLLANWEQEGLGADGVVTGMGTVGGRPVALMANDPAVKAGSWGPKTVEKILRIQERALSHQVPIVYLVDSAGARITDQVRMFPGRRGAGRIFHTQVRLSGQVPQVCLLFGPSAAGGAYIPAFCDVVIMRDGNASMYLGSPRMAEMVIGEKVTLEEMGGARMHTSVSGVGHFLTETDEDDTDASQWVTGRRRRRRTRDSSLRWRDSRRWCARATRAVGRRPVDDRVGGRRGAGEGGHRARQRGGREAVVAPRRRQGHRLAGLEHQVAVGGRARRRVDAQPHGQRLGEEGRGQGDVRRLVLDRVLGDLPGVGIAEALLGPVAVEAVVADARPAAASASPP